VLICDASVYYNICSQTSSCSKRLFFSDRYRSLTITYIYRSILVAQRTHYSVVIGHIIRAAPHRVVRYPVGAGTNILNNAAFIVRLVYPRSNAMCELLCKWNWSSSVHVHAIDTLCINRDGFYVLRDMHYGVIYWNCVIENECIFHVHYPQY